MRDNKLHTPDGVSDFSPRDWATKNVIQARMGQVFKAHGYEALSSPLFEFVEVFDGMGSVDNTQMYKFLDRDGSILALRADMTPVIARIVSTTRRASEAPFRYCYFENIYRYNESYQGKLKEYTQAGVELVGVNSAEASAEVVAVAVSCLLAAGLSDFRIDVGQVQFLEAIVESSGLSAENRRKVHNYIISGDYVAVSELFDETEGHDDLKAVIGELPLLIGGAEIITRAVALTRNQKALEALDNLRDIYDALVEMGVSDYISLDLSMAGQLDYYTGMIFKGYAPGIGLSVISGGRYDNLIAKFGHDYPSVGFGIRMSVLLQALKGQGVAVEPEAADTLLAYDLAGRQTAWRTAAELRRQGVLIENSLIGPGLEANLNYCRKRGLGGVLYFHNDNDVTIAEVNGGIRRVCVSDLMKG